MKLSITATVGLLLLTSCSAAWSQPKAQVASGGPTPAVAKASVASSASLSDLLKPTNDFVSWAPSTSPPALDCPQGASQERRTTDAGWETWCTRGSVKQGPARSFDRAARRELRQTFKDGALDGWSSEITLRPTLSLSGMSEPMRATSNIEEMARAAAELTTWAPSVAPPKLACPSGTSQVNESNDSQWVAECRRADDSVHGLSITQQRDGTEMRRSFSNGVQVGAVLLMNDGRTVRDTLYRKGAPVRVIERSASSLLTIELFRGDTKVLIRFHPNGGAAQLSRFTRGVRSGEWRWWHDSGKLAEARSYQNGVELPGGQRMDLAGNVIEVRKITQGTGVIESTNPGRSFEKTICEMKAGKNHGHCRTTSAKGQILDDTAYADGVPLDRKTWYEGGGLSTEWINDPKTGYSKQTNYHPSGRVEQISECRANICKTTTFDDKGNPTLANGQRAPGNDDVMREIQDML